MADPGLEGGNFTINGITKRLGVMTVWATAVGAVLTIAGQAEILEPYWPATRAYVRVQYNVENVRLIQELNLLNSRQIRMQISSAAAERSRMENEIASKRVLLQQNASMPQGVRDVIEEQIRSLQRSIEEKTVEIKSLTKEQGRSP